MHMYIRYLVPLLGFLDSYWKIVFFFFLLFFFLLEKEEEKKTFTCKQEEDEWAQGIIEKDKKNLNYLPSLCKIFLITN